MSLLSEFEDYKSRLDSELSDICRNKLMDEAYEEIFKQADMIVYDAYETKGFRRHSLNSRDNYIDKYYKSGDTHTIEIETNLTFQGTPWSPDLAVVITGGLSNFHQPGPRPWMKRSEEVMKEKAQGIVTSELIARGF